MKRSPSFSEHLHHKSHLGFLFITKIVVAFACFLLSAYIFFRLNTVIGNWAGLIVAMALVFGLYLFIIVKIVKLFEFA